MIIQTQHGKFSCSTNGKSGGCEKLENWQPNISAFKETQGYWFYFPITNPAYVNCYHCYNVNVTSGWWEVGEIAVFYSTHFLHFPKHTRMHDAQWCLLLLLVLFCNTTMMQGGTVSVVTAACHCQHHPGALTFPWCTSCKLKWQDLRWTWSLTITATSTAHRLPVPVSRAQHALRSLNTLN